MYMMRDIVRDGNPVLRKIAQPVQFPLSDADKKLASDMMEYLIKSQDPDFAQKHHLRAGVGLAAPQVGVSEQMACVLVPAEDADDADKTKKYALELTLINPVIISNSIQKAQLFEGEGCLSVDKDIPGYVPRSARITVRYQDFDGNKQTIRVKNYPAIVCQHEIDHLHGHLFYDHINKNDPFEKEPDVIIV
ncbi:peptide deformylase [Bombilactobacillus bombi]|uniref:Peptide deformylase n=1 Tax=Bombilactobacillus bombi TaxID=1303590 RepID=A0A3R6YLM8_9LACO|nr:peptide deformylase [Bombilactobacillus bombi]RHW46900.1 peptide deformylase [Bombilactobacillus bombi]RHW49949.1 peptide deformylase [Bombilactobacillus bombi]